MFIWLRNETLKYSQKSKDKILLKKTYYLIKTAHLYTLAQTKNVCIYVQLIIIFK